MAWQPITPRGIALLAQVPAGRVLTVQILAAVLAALIVLWFLTRAWFPVVRQAIEALPETGAIQAAQLSTPYDSPEPLAMNRFLGLVLDARSRVTATVASDVVIECRVREFRLCSIFGCYISAYPPMWRVDLSRTGMLALWEAWKPHLLWMAAAGTVVWLMAVWTVLATLYAPFVKAVVVFREREASLAACWRLAGAALMPGALLMLGGMVCYGLGVIGLIEFLVITGLHLVIGWVYLFLPIRHLSLRAGAVAKGRNPFQPTAPEPPPEADNGEPSDSGRRANPFASPPGKS